eukprot:3733078-Pleurochrysis_carterae.AAC.1
MHSAEQPGPQIDAFELAWKMLEKKTPVSSAVLRHRSRCLGRWVARVCLSALGRMHSHVQWPLERLASGATVHTKRGGRGRDKVVGTHSQEGAWERHAHMSAMS